MKARRAHAKSHFGCAQCKEKRVKCDESRPKCSRCAKRGSACSYAFIVFQNPSGVSKRRRSTQPSTSSSASSDLRIGPVPPPPPPQAVPPSSVSQFGPSSAGSVSCFQINPRRRPAACPDLNLTIPLPTSLPLPSFMSPKDQELYTYYRTVVSYNPNAVAIYDGLSIWGAKLRQLAPSQPLLYTGMIAMGSFHLALAKGSDQCRRQRISDALHRQTRAISEYRALLANLGPDNLEPALTFSGMLIVTAFARQSSLAQASAPSSRRSSPSSSPSSPGSPPTATPTSYEEDEMYRQSDPVTEFMDILALFRGTKYLFRLQAQSGRSSPRGNGPSTPVTPATATDQASASLSPAVRDRIVNAKQAKHPGEDSLELLIREYLTTPADLGRIDVEEANDWDFESDAETTNYRYDPIDPFPPARSHSDMYTSSIRKLKFHLRRMAAYPGKVGYALIWPSIVPAAFATALERRRPLALILLAHWAAALHDARHTWWVTDFGKRMVDWIEEELEEEWQPYIRWAVEHVRRACDDDLAEEKKKKKQQEQRQQEEEAKKRAKRGAGKAAPVRKAGMMNAPAVPAR